jgi:hypothetical protein
VGLLIGAQVAAVQPIDENLRLSDVSTQRGGLQPHRACPTVPANTLAFHPGQLGGHFVHLMAQRTDQLQRLGNLVASHDEMVALGARSRGETA